MLKKAWSWMYLVGLGFGAMYACGACCQLPKACTLFSWGIVSLMEDLGG